MKYEVYFKNYLTLIEKKLDQVLPKNGKYPPLIHDAMRYSVLNGGKRFRPVMVLAACEACGIEFGVDVIFELPNIRRKLYYTCLRELSHTP